MKRLPPPQSSTRADHEADAVVDPPLHLVGVHDGVHRPNVVGVHRQGSQTGRLGPAVVTRLLQAEGLHAACERRVGMVGVERGQAATGSVAQVRGVAEEEVQLVADLERQQVGRPDLQHARRGVAAAACPVTLRPCLDRGVVASFAIVHRELGHGRAHRPRRRDIAKVGARQVQVGEQRLGHGGVGVLAGELAGQGQDVVVVAQQAIDGLVVERDCLGCAAERVVVSIRRESAMSLPGHGQQLARAC